MSWWSRAANVFRAGRVERELDAELQFHLDERIRDLMAAGMSREAAARQARRRLGSPLRLREESRDVKLLPGLDSLVRDVRMGARMLRQATLSSPPPPSSRWRWRWAPRSPRSRSSMR